jgi:16S rRNA (adenine1518-N6/adenine1519-N6)-dimethyltransferase
MSSQFPHKTNQDLEAWTKETIKEYNIVPRKRLGQHFLIDRNALEKIKQAVELKLTDKVFEIGAGLGTITRAIAPYLQQVIAVEKDHRLIPILKKTSLAYPSIQVVFDDVFNLLAKKRDWSAYKIIGNPPYYLSPYLIEQILLLNPRPLSAVLVLQKEFGEKLTAQPPRANRLSILSQQTAQFHLVGALPAACFWPKPQIDSVIVKIVFGKQRKVPDDFISLVKIGFASSRKTLVNNLLAAWPKKKEEIIRALTNCQIDPRRRAGTLSQGEWQRLFRVFSKKDKIKYNKGN